MKFLFVSLVIISLSSYSQDVSKIRSIDSLVNIINRSKLNVQVDSLKTDGNPGGISSQSYVTTWRKGREVKKYVNKTYIQAQQNGTTQKMETIISFYYDRNTVLKVEQSMTKGSAKSKSEFYYYNDKPIYSTPSMVGSSLVSQSMLANAKEILKTLSE